VREADTLAVLLPDEAVPAAWPELAPHLAGVRTFVFAHGFNLLYGSLAFPEVAAVVLVSPTGPGRVIRELYEQGAGVPAYLAVHQLCYLAELLHARGVAGLRHGISGTALYGDLTRGPRVIGPASRWAMERMLAEIRSGEFAQEWLAEVAAGRPLLDRLLAQADADPIEEGRRRALGSTPGPPGPGTTSNPGGERS
jgi:ketol-acid reductoisomerase